MKNVTIILDDYGDIVAAGLNEWEVKDYAFDKAYSDMDEYEWSELLEDLDYSTTEDLRADTVMRDFDDLWDYLGWDFKEDKFIGEGE